MTTIGAMKRFGFGAAALVFAACVGSPFARNASAFDRSGRVAPGEETKVELIRLETSAYEAWKSKDAKFWGGFIADNFVGWGSSGRLDKTSAAREYAGTDCEIKSYALSDGHVSLLEKNVALMTYTAVVSGTCGGQTLPTNSRAAAIYVREDGKWKGAFHAQDAIVDPSKIVAKTSGGQPAMHADDSRPVSRNAGTEGMLAVEREVWEAWRVHDTQKIGELTAKDITFINIFGTYLPNKAEALKDWSATYCDVKSIRLNDAMGTMVAPTVGILTFKAAADGTCYGQRVGDVWGTSVYVKAGEVWKWTFGINLPAGGEGN